MNRSLSPTSAPQTLLEALSTQLGEQELRRRLWHFLPGVIALSLAAVPHQETVRLWVMMLIVGCGILLPAALAVRYQRAYCRRPGENIGPSILGYVLPLSVLCLLCRAHIEIPLAVAAVIAFGDGSATLTGLLVQGAKVPWNSRKSWAGLFAFAIVGTLMATLVFWIGASRGVSLQQALFCVAPMVVVCSVLETLPLKLNDNITIGCVAGVLLVAMQALVIGW